VIFLSAHSRASENPDLAPSFADEWMINKS
jgi:hypothetical protein